MSLDDRGRESLASLLDGVAIEHDVAASRLCPDFADAVARACRHAHDRDLAPLVAAARRIDPAGGDQLRRIARIGDLDALVASARATIEQAAAEHRPGTPPVRTTARAPVRAVVLAAIAAVLVAALVVDWRWRGHAVDPAHAGGYSGASKTAEGHPWSEATITADSSGSAATISPSARSKPA